MCMRGVVVRKRGPLQGGVYACQLYPRNKYVQKHITCCWPGSGLVAAVSGEPPGAVWGVTVASVVVALVDWPANCCACRTPRQMIAEGRQG